MGENVWFRDCVASSQKKILLNTRLKIEKKSLERGKSSNSSFYIGEKNCRKFAKLHSFPSKKNLKLNTQIKLHFILIFDL